MLVGLWFVMYWLASGLYGGFGERERERERWRRGPLMSKEERDTETKRVKEIKNKERILK